MNESMAYTQRLFHLKAEGAYEVMTRAQALEAAGGDIIHMEIGQPDFETFSNISQAGIRAISEGRTRYTPTAGIGELRQAIAEDAGRRRGMDVRAEQVVVSPGAKPNLFFPTLALVEPGDEVICPNPGFPTYEAMIGVAGGRPIAIPLLEKNGFSFDLDRFDESISKRTKLIILNSPANPTGGMMPRPDLEHVAESALRHNLWVLSDEIYARIVYDDHEHVSIASLPGMQERSVIMDGFSKTYAMTGWRLGFGIMPETLADRVQLLLTHSVGSTAHFTQYAGIEALTGPQDQAAEMVRAFQRRRDVVVEGLNKLPGVRCQRPLGAFYAFPNIEEYGLTSAEMANMLLEEVGVALLPGTAFGDYGEGYLRLSYAISIERIQEALARMEAVL